MPHKHKPHLLTFILAIIFVITVFVFSYAHLWINSEEEPQTRFGITFSTIYAQQLGLDVQESYKALVEDLGVDVVRIPIYWSEVESSQGTFNWEVYDWLVDVSERNDVKLTIAIGEKVPRWPECFTPDWAEKLNAQYQHRHIIAFMKAVVERYKGSSAIERWQVENEPFFPFGECGEPVTPEQFQERVQVVRDLDRRPIQSTVSGEISPWKETASAVDILGLSMYRQTWNDFFGYFIYPITPEFYQIRAQLVRDDVERVIVSELQAEPWFPEPIENRPLSEWYDAFDAELFENNISFAQRSGLSEAYLWGAEWWYLLKINGDDRLWEVAKKVFEN